MIADIVRRLLRLEKVVEENRRLIVHDPLNAGKAKVTAISAGAIEVVRPWVLVTPETGTSDDLDSIAGGADGKMVVVSPANDGDTITVTPYTLSGGNIDLRGSGNGRVLADRHDSVFLIYRADTGHWEQVGPDTLNSLVGVTLDAPPTDNDVLIYDAGTGNWINAPVPAGGVPAAHAPSHQHSGGDEVATATPAANAIVKADADGKIGAGWLDDADIDHGSIGGLADDDHAQYHNDARGDARYFTEVEHLNVSAGAGDAGKPIVLDAGGHVDATMINDADINLDNVTEGATNKFFDATEESKLAGIEALADVTDAGNVGAAIHGSTEQVVLSATDRFALTDAGVLKYAQWSTILATISGGAYVDLTTDQVVAGVKTWSNNAIFSASVGIGDATPDYTLELSGATAPKFGMSDTGLAHGITDFAQTDTFFLVDQVTDNDGGARIWGFSDTASLTPLRFTGAFGVLDPTDTTPAVRISGTKRSGTSTAALANSETILGVSNSGTDVAVVMADGRIVAKGTTPISTAALTVYNAADSVMAFFQNNLAATYSDATPSAAIYLDSKFTAEPAAWNTARIKWGYANTFGLDGARFGIDLINDAGNYLNFLTAIATGSSKVYVGIGTSAPAAQLHVAGSSGYTAISPDGAFGSYISLLANSGQEASIAISNTTASWQLWMKPSDASLYIYNGTERVMINSSGRVVIGGTVSNGQPLQINYAAGPPGVEWSISNTAKAYIGVANAADHWVTGAVANDFVLRVVGGAMLFSVDNGTTAKLRIASGGKVTVNSLIDDTFAQLFVEGAIRTRQALYVDRPSGNYSAYMGLVQYASGVAGNLGAGITGHSEFYAIGNGGIGITTIGSLPLYLGTNSTARLTIVGTGEVYTNNGLYPSKNSATIAPLTLTQSDATGIFIELIGTFSGAAIGTYQGKFRIKLNGSSTAYYVAVYA